MSSLTLVALEQAVKEITSRAPHLDHMDEALRRFELRHQFAIVGYALGEQQAAQPGGREAWIYLLATVNKRAEPVVPIEPPGYRRLPRPYQGQIAPRRRR